VADGMAQRRKSVRRRRMGGCLVIALVSDATRDVGWAE
jgi:hypothetical protein